MPEEKEITTDEKKVVDISKELHEIEIRSDDVQEILGFIPHWIVRWGITIIFLVVIFILVGSWFFKYPEVITSNVVLTTQNPPATLVAHTTGKIEALFVQDKEKVKKGSKIAILENATDYHHLFELMAKLDSMKSFFIKFDTQPYAQFSKDYSLGQLQVSYAGFVSAYEDYQHFFQLDIPHKKINSINAQIAGYKIIAEQNKRSLQIMEEELKAGRKQFESSESLFKDGIISRNDYDAARSSLSQKELAWGNAKSALDNSNIQISQLTQQVLELDLGYTGETKRLQQALSQAYEGLNGQIAQWEQTYLLKAPISGVVTFTKFWSINQNVSVGDKVVTIIPDEGGEIVGKLVLPIQGSGKVKIGQKVNFKFLNYPYMDFGIVSGVITTKSLVASDNYYSLEVRLTNGLVTSFKKTLEFSQEMQGTAEIITEDYRLIDQIFKPLKNILDKM
jgi:multidrug resistance efflux pump